jgi:hypothetical protein
MHHSSRRRAFVARLTTVPPLAAPTPFTNCIVVPVRPNVPAL